jgi:hypothetical protein
MKTFQMWEDQDQDYMVARMMGEVGEPQSVQQPE